jgi:flagellar M-ring protein FliF
MEPLLNQLRELPKALAALPAGIKFVAFGAALAVIGLGVHNAVQGAEAYQYAFTNLTPEDSAEAAGTLKNAGVPFRLEAGGSALAVPAAKVYDARLLLAGAGLPRGGGVGFEIFDRGDLGVSEFTQKVNLRRATEGELARTISKLTQVRTARVHLTMPEKGLFRDQDKGASAAVVVNLQPGRTLGDREIAGIRHLVSAAVPGLASEGVTVVDGKGEVLTAEGGWGQALGYQKKLEHDLERRVVDLLEQAVGPGAVVARITAAVDANEVQTSAEVVDPDTTALRSERRVTQSAQGATTGAAGGVAGAAANQPLAPAAPAATTTPGRGSSSTMEDQIRNFDVSRTTTTTLAKVPRLQKISVAVLVDGVNGQPRAQAELDKLGELARRAVGFDQARGDEFDITSAPFTRSEEAPGEAAPAAVPARPWWIWAAVGGGVLLLLLVGFLALRRKPAPVQVSDLGLLTPGSSVAQIEAALAREAALPPSGVPPRPALQDPAASLRERARELAAKDPTRAAHILKAWMAQEQQRSQRSPNA